MLLLCSLFSLSYYILSPMGLNRTKLISVQNYYTMNAFILRTENIKQFECCMDKHAGWRHERPESARPAVIYVGPFMFSVIVS